MNKKVLFIITKSNWGGAQRYVFDMTTNLPQDKFSVAVAFGGSGERNAAPGMLDKRLRAAGVRTIFIRSFMRDISLTQEWGAFWELVSLLRAENPDVVHLNSSKAGGLGALAARIAGVPQIIFTVHGLPYEESRNILRRGAMWLATWATFLFCTQVITISRRNYASAYRMPMCSGKIRLVHNGALPTDVLERTSARDALIPKSTTKGAWIGAVAELTWNKGLHHLVHAAGILKRDGKQFIVCIVGDGEEREFLQTLISEEDVGDCVQLVGFVPDAARYMSAFDIFALPSSKEGLPYVLIEAGQVSAAVVASDVGGVSDIIINEKTGLLCKPENHHDLARALTEAIDHPGEREVLGNALRAHVEKEFSLNHMVSETVAVYAYRS